MGLFAVTPIDEVSIGDIAAVVEMTPAAVYYHFPSKEQILCEGMEQFRAEIVAETRAHLPVGADPAELGELLAHLIRWSAKNRAPSAVYYIASVGLNQTVEALRRKTRVEMVEQLSIAIVSVRPKTKPAEAATMAVGLVSLLETALAALLNQLGAPRGLGVERMAEEVASIGLRMVGCSPAQGR